MSVTILEVLQNAKFNLVDNLRLPLSQAVGREQLKNAVTLLEKGYQLDEDFDTVMGSAEIVDDVPEKLWQNKPLQQ